MHQQNLPQYGKVIHSLENRYKFKAINDIYKDYLKICLNFHIFVTLYIYKNKGAAQGQLPTGGGNRAPVTDAISVCHYRAVQTRR